jgi:hypothetical protein
MATAFAHDIPDTVPPLSRAASKLALVASAGVEAIAAGLAQPTFAEAHAEVQRLFHAESNLAPGFTDEELDAACDRSSAAVKVLIAVPSGNAREAFQKVDAIRAIYEAHAVPYLAETLDELRGFMTPAGADAKGDEPLVAAWERWKSSSSSITGEGVGCDSAADRPHVEVREEAEQLILDNRAAAEAGLLVKLRLALDHTHLPEWASRALYAGNDQVLFARSDELDVDSRLIVDVMAFLSKPARSGAGVPVTAPAGSPVRTAFEAWIAARITYDLADSVLEPNEDPAYLGWIEAERTLAATPPQSAEDMLFKLFPLALSEHGPNAHQGTFELVYKPAGPVDAPYLDDSTWRGLIDGMLALSPRLAEVVAMPAVRVPEIKPNMWLPDAIPLDQMEQWLGHLTEDAEAYAKLWLRMVDMSKMAAVVRIDGDGAEALCLGGSMDDCTAEHMAIDRALRSHLRSSGHRDTVIGQLKAKGRCYDHRQAVAA